MEEIPYVAAEAVENKVATQRAAKLMDRLVPGWHRRIDLNRFHMSSGSLCMLGQTFGHETELAIGKEMYPELWKKMGGESPWANNGYMIGRRVIAKLLGWRKAGDWETAEGQKEYQFLEKACAGYETQCFWAEEIAERIANDEASNQKQDDSVESPA